MKTHYFAGIGIDDMFVILQCFGNAEKSRTTDDLGERIGSAMRHAGVAITVTSLTDVCAFAIGCITVCSKSALITVTLTALTMTKLRKVGTEMISECSVQSDTSGWRGDFGNRRAEQPQQKL